MWLIGKKTDRDRAREAEQVSADVGSSARLLQKTKAESAQAMSPWIASRLLWAAWYLSVAKKNPCLLRGMRPGSALFGVSVWLTAHFPGNKRLLERILSVLPILVAVGFVVCVVFLLIIIALILGSYSLQMIPCTAVILLFYVASACFVSTKNGQTERQFVARREDVERCKDANNLTIVNLFEIQRAVEAEKDAQGQIRSLGETFLAVYVLTLFPSMFPAATCSGEGAIVPALLYGAIVVALSAAFLVMKNSLMKRGQFEDYLSGCLCAKLELLERR